MLSKNDENKNDSQQKVAKKYFYYVRWWLASDDEVPEGLYHSAYVCTQPPYEFLSNVYKRDFIGEYFIKQFETEEEMRVYFESQG